MSAYSQTPNLDRLGLVLQREIPDGNCWFYAVARQLYGDPSQHRRLRNELASHFDRIAKDRSSSERFVFPNGMIDVNAAGRPRYANRNMPLVKLKKGDPIPAPSIYYELTQIVGFRPPEKGDTSTPQEIVKAYADSLRGGMYAGDIESTLIHELYGVVVRTFIPRGNDVVHIRSFDSIPNYAPRPDFYRKCFPPECINLLYNGVNHYDSLVMAPTRKAAEDPNAANAAAFGMSVNNYKRAKKQAENFEKQKAVQKAPPPPSLPSRPVVSAVSQVASFTRKKRAVINAIKSYAGSGTPTLQTIGRNLLPTLNEPSRNTLLRKTAMSIGMSSNALVQKFKTTAGGTRKKRSNTKKRMTRKA